MVSRHELLSALLPVFAYCMCSAAMIYTNKAILTTFLFHYPTVLLVVQSGIGAVVLYVLNSMDVVTVEPLTATSVVQWLPVATIFCTMIFTSTKAMELLPIPHVNVFKQTTNIAIAFGDWYLYGNTVTAGVGAALACMVAGSLLTGHFDTIGTTQGYIWMALNVLSTASYSLYVKRAQRQANLGNWGMSYHSNALCFAMLLPFAFVSGEASRALAFDYLGDGSFQLLIVFSGIVGTLLGFTLYWLIGATSPTTVSMVGSLNKVPMTFISLLVFDTPLTQQSTISIAFGLASGVFYSFAKYHARGRATTGDPVKPIGRPEQSV